MPTWSMFGSDGADLRQVWYFAFTGGVEALKASLAREPQDIVVEHSNDSQTPNKYKVTFPEMVSKDQATKWITKHGGNLCGNSTLDGLSAVLGPR